MNEVPESDSAEANSVPKLQVPRFHSYRPVASGSTGQHQGDTCATPHLSSLASSSSPKDHASHTDKRNRTHRHKTSQKPKHDKPGSDRGLCFRRDRGGACSSRHDETLRKRSNRINAEEYPHHSSRDRSRSPTSLTHHRSRRRRRRSDSDFDARGPPSVSRLASPAAKHLTEIEDSQTATFDRNLFFTDTRGDRDALIYGQDRSKVPKAHRISRSQHTVGTTVRDSATISTSNPHVPPGIPDVPAPDSQSGSSASLQPAEDFIGVDSPSDDFSSSDDPFDPTRPYIKRDSRYEQVGGGPISYPQVTTIVNSPNGAASDPSILSLLMLQSRKDRPVGIQDLPVEVLHRILVLSRSSSFPFICRYFRQVCQSASMAEKSDYILNKWVDFYMSYVTTNPCRDRHKACRSLARRLASLWRVQDPSWFEFVKEISTQDCTVYTVLKESLDVISFATELGICSPALLERVVSDALASDLPSTFLAKPEALNAAVSSQALSRASTSSGTFARPLLPKRLFRRIDNFDYLYTTTDPPSGHVRQKHQDELGSAQPPPKKRRRRRHGATSAKATTETESSMVSIKTEVNDNVSLTRATFPVWLSHLLQSLACAPRKNAPRKNAPRAREKTVKSVHNVALEDTCKRKHLDDDAEEIKRRIGPVPNAEELQLIFVLLHQYGADASSHQGYPLAMAVHRQSYSLVHLLLLFGADPHCKDGLAAQIAIRNGSREILHLLVSGPCLDADGTDLPVPAVLSYRAQIGSQPFRLNQTHLRLAIQCRQWELVDYIWHERNVSPDIACLRLIEKLRQ